MPLTTATDPERRDESRGPSAALPLAARLGAALEAAGIACCQWKGHGKYARWMAGDGDIDLLVARSSADAFTTLVERMGFKLAVAAPDRQVPGVASYLGLDPVLGRLIHVHAHFRMVLGPSGQRHYHLAIEHAVLASAVPRAHFRTPAPEFELILFVIQQTLRHNPLGRPATQANRQRLQQELQRLMLQVEPANVVRTLAAHVPDVEPAFFAECLDALRPGTRLWRLLFVRQRMRRRLSAHRLGPPATAVLRTTMGRVARFAGLMRDRATKRLARGGAVIALQGADGAGKSTCAKMLEGWLATELQTDHVHLGRPPRSLTTRLVGVVLKAARMGDRLLRLRQPSDTVAHLELARVACTARDRYRLYRRVAQRAAQGALVICERYPTPENGPLAGPSHIQGVGLEAASPLATWVRHLEARWYKLMAPPDLELVLRVDPEVAVRRKPDEPEAYVRRRARIMWDTDWSAPRTRVLDAGRPLDDVAADLRARVWESL